MKNLSLTLLIPLFGIAMTANAATISNGTLMSKFSDFFGPCFTVYQEANGDGTYNLVGSVYHGGDCDGVNVVTTECR